MNQESSQEVRICRSCWDKRSEVVSLHHCDPTDGKFRNCVCPCESIIGFSVWLSRKHMDLDGWDLEHDQGLRYITDPFTKGPSW